MPDINLSRSTEATVAPTAVSPATTRWIGIAAVLLLLATMSAVWLTFRNAERVDWVRHTLEVESQLNAVMARVEEAETSQRGYLLTGKEIYLAPYAAAEASLTSELDRLAALIADNPAQQRELAVLRPQIAAKLAELRETVTRQQAGDTEAALTILRDDRGRDLMVGLRRTITAMRASEEQLLALRDTAANTSQRLLLAATLIAGLLALVCALAWARSLTGTARQLVAANRQSTAANLGLEQQLDDRSIRLASSEAEFRILAESMPSLMFATGRDGGNTYTNSRYQQYTGFASEQLLGAGWMPILHPDDLFRIQAAWQASLANGTAFENEFRIHRHDGAWRWFLCRAEPVRGPDGNITRWIGTCTDIDDRKRAEVMLVVTNAELEARIAERSRELDRIFRLSLDMLIVSDFDRRFRRVSPAWERITGHTIDYALIRDWLEFVHPNDHALSLAAFERLKRGEPAVNFENRYERADGSYCWVAWRSVSSPEEGLIYNVGRDVTEERSRDEQLRQSQKMEVVGQLTGGIAHDFNNLLTIITGSLELLRRGVATIDPKLVRRVDAAMEGAKRAASLTHRLLAFSRRQPLEPKPVEANRLVAGMSDMLARTLGGQIAIETVLAAGLWQIFADPNQLENAILNLAVNARDAMADGGKLTIETANVHLDEAYTASKFDVAPGQYAMVAVTDTGIGMSHDIQARVFEPFFTTKPEGQGTGLGLSQVYGFAKQSGGHVAIYSEPGEGTTVRLYLPRARGAVRTDAMPASNGAAVDPRARGETILVVEDETGVRDFAVEVLQELGYQVLAADSALRGLELLAATPAIDLLFTDVVLGGGMNGRQMADEAQRRRPGLRVLFTTGYTRNAIIHNGRLDEGVAFIGKPFTLSALADKVHETLLRPAVVP